MRVYAHQSCPHLASKLDQRGLTQSTYGGGLTRIERTYAVRRAARQGNALVSALLPNVYAVYQEFTRSLSLEETRKVWAHDMHARINAVRSILRLCLMQT